MRRKPVILLHFRRGSPLLKIVLLAVIVLSTAAMLSMRAGILSQKRRLEELRTQAKYLEQESAALESNIAQLDTPQGVIQIAEDELGLVVPGTVIFVPEE